MSKTAFLTASIRLMLYGSNTLFPKLETPDLRSPSLRRTKPSNQSCKHSLQFISLFRQFLEVVFAKELEIAGE
jgi:hypothetical protein